MRLIAVTNEKGGAGKTTTAVCVAACLSELGKRVLVLDLDPQASASAWLGVTDAGRGLLEVFTNNGNLADLVHATPVSGVDVVPSSTWLASVDKALAGEVGAEGILRKALQRLPADRWDFLLVDCPPSLGLLTVSALAACHEVLVPCAAHFLALAGLAALTQTVETVRERLNPELHVSAIVACRVNARTRLSSEVVDSLRKTFGPLVLKAVVRESTRLAEAPSYAQPITAYDPHGHGAEDYRAVAKELLKKGG